MIKPIAPCKNCTNRYVGCHSKCKIFKEYTDEKAKYQNEKKKERRVNKLPTPKAVKDFIQRRKNNNLCISCGKPLDRDGVRCTRL